MRKWLLYVLLLVAVGAGTFVLRQQGLDKPIFEALQGFTASNSASQTPAQPTASQGKRPPATVEVAEAIVIQVSDDVAAIGTLLADESAEIAPETSGRVAEILFADGSEVKEGDTLFRLDKDLAVAALAQAKSRLALAEANFGRNEKLRKSGNVAQSVYDESATEVEVARTTVETADVLMRKLTVQAPFSGTLGFRTVSRGAYVAAGTVLVQLDKIDRLKASFSLPELEQSRVAVGQKVELTADALPQRRFAAEIAAIEPSLDVNGRALKVRAALDNAERLLRPGLLVRVEVRGAPRDAVVVPEAAIVRRGEDVFVFVADGGVAKRVKVSLGKRMPGVVEIRDGIAAGAAAIVAGQARLADGAAIEIVPAPPAVD